VWSPLSSGEKIFYDLITSRIPSRSNTFHFPEHWIPILGLRIQNLHLKDFSKEGTDLSFVGFRPLLDRTAEWLAVMEAYGHAGKLSHVSPSGVGSMPQDAYGSGGVPPPRNRKFKR
jgi:hypothetical protein